MATKQLAQKGGGKVLEPIMKVEVVTPEDYMGDVMGDLNRRRGLIQGWRTRFPVRLFVPRFRWVRCSVMRPTRSMSQGRASYSMEFSNTPKLRRTSSKRWLKQG